MKTQFTSWKLLRRFNLGRIFWLLCLALATCAAPSTLSAQEKEKGIFTLMPIEVQTGGANCDPLTIEAKNDQPTCKIILRFQTNSVPAGANLTAAHLMLVGRMRGTQTITVLMDANPVPFGEITPQRQQSFPPGKRAVWPASREFMDKGFLDKIKVPNAPPFSLVLQTGSRGLASQWDWKENGSDESGSRPRLVIEYTVPGPAVVLTEGLPATHSPALALPTPALDLPTSSAGAQFTSRTVANIWSYAPVSYKGLLHVITQNQLQALSPLGGPPVWSLPLASPGQHLVLSESGRVYIVGNSKVLAYQLDRSNAATPATEVKSTGSPKSVPDLSLTLPPAVGRDGSLYFVNRQAVYGLNPDLQELWKVTLEDPKTSRVTVGPSGQFVYLLGKKGDAVGLIAIDARTGEFSAANLPIKWVDTTTLQAPIVLLHQNLTEKIYVAANTAGTGALAAFDNPKTTVTGREKNITAPEHWPSLTGLFSQPTAFIGDASKIYYVQVTETQGQWRGQLKAIDWLTGPPQSVGVDFPVNAGSYLLNGGNLAIDKGGNVFVWTGAEAKLYAFAPGGAFGVAPAGVAGLAANSPLLFGSDGTLYAPTPTNSDDRELKAILPQYTLGDSSSPDIFSPTHLRVDGTVNKNTTLSAPGSVFLGNGFTVKQGFTLTIKQPKP